MFVSVRVMRMKAADPAVKTEALEMRRAGWTIMDTAAAVGVSPQCVGRWSKKAGITAKVPERRRKKHIDRTHPAYGFRCPHCHQPKSVGALMCIDCRQASRRDEHIIPYCVAALADAWPMPIAYPPIVPGVPRTVRGVLHVETDGSERHG